MEQKKAPKKPPPVDEKSAAVAAKDVVTKVLPNDILLGRGALAIGNEGNVRFRGIIKERKVEYMATSRRRLKDIIAGEVRAEIARRNGRFIRRIALGEEQYGALGLTTGAEAWVIADEETVMQKIKQSLRDKESESSSKESTPWASSEDTGFSDTRMVDARDLKRPRTDPSASISTSLATFTEPSNGAMLASPFSLSNLSQSHTFGHTQIALSNSESSSFQGIDPRVIAALSASLQQGSSLSQGNFLPAQQQYMNLAEQSSLLNQINVARQEGERQLLLRRIQEEQAAAMLRMQQQDPYFAALCGHLTGTATGAFSNSNLSQSRIVQPQPPSLQTILQAYQSQNLSLLPTAQPAAAAAQPKADTDTDSSEEESSPKDGQKPNPSNA